MSFPSRYQHLIWNKLYRAMIPDQLTLDPTYIKRFGVHVTGDKKFDKVLSSTFTSVMIPISAILEYFETGIEVQIPSREDLIQIHKDIELYLQEWRDHLQYDINVSVKDNKDLIIALEKLSKHVYNKARPNEVIDRLVTPKAFGIVNPLQRAQEAKKEIVKPDYNGISQLVRAKSKPRERY